MTRPLTGIAKRVYDDILAAPDDDTARLYTAMVIAAGLQHDMDAHHDLIQKRIDDVVRARLATAKEGVLKSFVSKRMAGDSVDTLVAAAETIAKVDFDPNDYPSWERRQNVMTQARDPRGRFRVMNRKISYQWDKHAAGRQAARMGIPDRDSLRGNKEARKEFQQAYLQVADLLGRFREAPHGAADVVYVYQTPHGTEQRMQNLTDANTAVVDDSVFAQGGRLTEVSVITPRDLTAAGAAFDLVGALGGSPAVAGRVTSLGAKGENGQYKGKERLKQFGQDWHRYNEEDVSNPANRVYRRVGSGSEFLGSILGPLATPRMKMALEAGKMVEQYGPEAQKVFGPAADRAAYRYRGVERTPEPALQATINSVRAEGREKNWSPDAVRNVLIYGGVQARGSHVESGTEPAASPLIAYFQNRLAKPELTHLQRKSGTIPPSEGVIIDRKGNIVTQAVGYGDDWYLPFNLKTLSRVKGGEYIRTRSWGGPTTEDIYAGLMTGARAVTVVSHNGVYTIEFDPAFRGSRRYSDKAARMVRRYGQLLDAVKSTEVTLMDIPRERRDELSQEVIREGFNPKIPEEKAGYEKRMKAKLDEEREDPQMPKSMRDETDLKFLNEEADRQLPGAVNPNWQTLASHLARMRLIEMRNQRAAAVRAYPNSELPPLDEEGLLRQYQAESQTPQAALGLLLSRDENAARRYKTFRDHELAEYQRSMKPLTLDGSGYDKAQKALREQFPYYISNTRWEQPRPGGFDYGYVKPRYTRPQGALAGYYDPTIGGVASGLGAVKRQHVKPGEPAVTGKIEADKTRYQNYYLRQAVGDQLKVKPADGEGATAEGGTTGTTAASPQASALRQQIAVRKLAAKMLDNPEIFVNGVQGRLNQRTEAGVTAREELKAIAPIYTYSDTNAFMEFWNRNVDEANKILTQSAQALKDGGYLRNLAEDDIAAVKNPEGARIGKKWNLLDAISNPESTFDFGEGFGPDGKPEQYANRARRMLENLPVDATLDDPDLQSKLTSYIQDQASILEHVHEAGYREHYSEEQIEGNIKRAMQVKQLRRRVSEAYDRLQAQQARDQARQDMERRRLGGAQTLVVSGPGYPAEAQRRAAEMSQLEEPTPRIPSLDEILRGDE